MAQVIARFDLIALQEVMTEVGLRKLEETLEQSTGEPWESLVSAPVGQRGERERYAYLWRTRAIQYLGSAHVYGDPDDAFDRDPFSARFQIKALGSEVVLATLHVRHGRDKAVRRREVAALAGYWTWLRRTYGPTPPLLLGDFNLEPNDVAWQELRGKARPLITEGATTLSSTEGRFAHLYDNIWVPAQDGPAIATAGVLAYPAAIGWPHKKARRHVSDHAPVYVVFGGSD